MGMDFVSWEIYGASPISLGACTKYTSLRQGHGARGRSFDPQEPPRGKNVQVYYYLGKGRQAHYGGKKDEREAIFLSLVPTWSSGQHVRFRCKRFEVRGIASVSFFSCRLVFHMVPISHINTCK